MGRFLVVGEALVDVAVDPGGTTTTRPGGSPMNIAVGCARLGTPTVLATQLGTDRAGERVREHVEASGVEIRALSPRREHTSVARALLDAVGHATYEFELEWDPVELPAPDGFALVHLGSIGAALQPGADAVVSLAEDANARGVPVSFDPNVRPTITPDLDAVRTRTAELAARATVVKLSDEDADTLYPGSPDVLGELVSHGPTVLAVMTCGGRRIRLRSPSANVDITPPEIDVVDTIGAGDSFMSALLVRLLDDGFLDRGDLDARELREVGTYAAHAAAITCGRAGADPPTRAELDLQI